MIYFLLNNNYQNYDLKLHLLEIDRQEVSLILVPYTLDEDKYAGYCSVFRYPRASKLGLIAQVKNHYRQMHRFNREVHPGKCDVLFIYTEFDLLNQYIVAQFKKIGAKVYLIEDGGLATYLPFRMPVSEPLSAKERIKQWIYRRLPDLHTLRLHKLNGHIFPWMADTYIDGVCLYRPVSIRRNIQTILLQRAVQPHIAPTCGTVVFLNEQMYHGYQAPKNYLEGLLGIMAGLCHGFETVFFKFHPREDAAWRLRITREVLNHFPKVKVIADDASIEEVIDLYRPSVAASYFSAGLLNLLDRGVEPLYLYHLLPDLSEQPICREATSVLLELGYNFVSDLAEIDSNFKSGLMRSSQYPQAITLAELVAANKQ